MTRAPARLASERAGPAPRGLNHHGLARFDPPAPMDERVRGQALDEEPRRLLVVDRVGDLDEPRLGDRHPLGISPGREERGHPAAIRRAARNLATRDQRQPLLGEVVVAGCVRVAEVDPAPGDLDEHLAVTRNRVG
jgi:hypothetical protein